MQVSFKLVTCKTVKALKVLTVKMDLS